MSSAGGVRRWREFLRRRPLVHLAVAVAGVSSLTMTTTGGEPAGRAPGLLQQLSGDPANPAAPGDAGHASVADDGTTAFVFSGPLVPGDDNGGPDVYVQEGSRREWISGQEATEPGEVFDGVTAGPSICASGRFVAYVVRVMAPPAEATLYRLVVTDRDTSRHVFLPTRPAASGPPSAVRMSADCQAVVFVQDGALLIDRRDAPTPEPSVVAADGSEPSVSGDGNAVAFTSSDPALVPGDTNGSSDVFVHAGLLTPDPGDDSVVRVSVSTNGDEADGPSHDPSISRDGSTVAFDSYATNLVDGDHDGQRDVFVHNATTGATDAVTAGTGGNGDPQVTADGRTVAFTATAYDPPPDMVPTNFYVLDRSGRRRYGTRILEIDGPRVRVAFPTVDLAALRPGRRPGATAAGVESAALTDHQVIPVTVAGGRSNANLAAYRYLALPPDGAGAPPAADPAASGGDVTDGPDLLSAVVVTDDGGTPDDPGDDGPAIRYCFDETVAGALPGSGGAGVVATDRFLLGGYNSAATVKSVSARTSPPADPDPCATVRFPAGIDVTRLTVALVAADAVVDTAGRTDPPAAVALTGSAFAPQPGDVTGPNLRNVRVNAGADQATFRFDSLEAVAPGDHPAARFAFLDRAGASHPASSVVIVNPPAGEVTVAFGVGTDAVSQARRFVVGAGAVQSGTGETNVDQSTTGDVAGPALAGVAAAPPAPGPHDPAAPAAYEYRFDGDVRAPDPSRFHLFTEDGTRFTAASARAEGTVVHAEFPGVPAIGASLVLGVADRGAVHQRVGAGPAAVSGADSTPGGSAITRPVPLVTGRTDAPDLLTTTAVPDAGAVDYVFDEPVAGVHLSPETPAEIPAPTDVFAGDRDTGEVVRVSVDNRGRPVAGVASDPSISGDGRFVSFVSTDPTLTGRDLDGGAPDVFRRDLAAIAVVPAEIDFARSDGRIRVTNVGLAPISVRPVTIGGGAADAFRIGADGCSDHTLVPGEACTIRAGFSPTAAGALMSRLVVRTTAPGGPKTVRLLGVGPRALGGADLGPGAEVSLASRTGGAGSVLRVRGAGFPAGITLDVSLVNRARPPGEDRGTPHVRTVTNAAGAFGPVPLFVLPGEEPGPRLVVVTSGRPEIGADAPFLIVPGSAQPTSEPFRATGRPPLAGRR